MAMQKQNPATVVAGPVVSTEGQGPIPTWLIVSFLVVVSAGFGAVFGKPTGFPNNVLGGIVENIGRLVMASIMSDGLVPMLKVGGVLLIVAASCGFAGWFARGKIMR